jgi:hypothetical protein
MVAALYRPCKLLEESKHRPILMTGKSLIENTFNVGRMQYMQGSDTDVRPT